MTVYGYWKTKEKIQEEIQELLQEIITKDSPNNSEILSLIIKTSNIRDCVDLDPKLENIVNILFTKLTTYNQSALSPSQKPNNLVRLWEEIQATSSKFL